MGEPWTVRLAVEVGKAQRPTSDDRRAKPSTHTQTRQRRGADYPRPNGVVAVEHDNKKATASATTSAVAAPSSSSSSSSLVTVVALVVKRERTVAVYCKGRGETVPCTRLYVADDTYEGMRVVLWRTHAGIDVGEVLLFVQFFFLPIGHT